MKKILFLMALALSLCLTVLSLPDSAEAKRLGGGRSFGSKPAYSQKYQKSFPQQPNQQGAPQGSRILKSASVERENCRKIPMATTQIGRASCRERV